MPAGCSPDLYELPSVDGRQVVAAFDGGRMTSDAGALLLGMTDRAIGLARRFAACFVDRAGCRPDRASRRDAGDAADRRYRARLRGSGRP